MPTKNAINWNQFPLVSPAPTIDWNQFPLVEPAAQFDTPPELDIDFGALSDEDLAQFGTSREAISNDLLQNQPPAQGTTFPFEPVVLPATPTQAPQPPKIDWNQFPLVSGNIQSENTAPIVPVDPLAPTSPGTPLGTVGDAFTSAAQGLLSPARDVAKISDYFIGTEVFPKVDKVINGLFPVGNPDSFTAEIGSGLGFLGSSITASGAAKQLGKKLFDLGPVGIGVAEKLGLGGTSLASGLSSGISDVEEAPNASRYAKFLTLTSNAALGLTDVLPAKRIIDRLDKIGLSNKVPALLDRLLSERTNTGLNAALRGAIEEGGQEVAQTFGQDAAAEWYLGLERDIMSDMVQAGVTGGAVGSMANFFAGRRGYLKKKYNFTEEEIQSFMDIETQKAVDNTRNTLAQVNRALQDNDVGDHPKRVRQFAARMAPVVEGVEADLTRELKGATPQEIEQVRSRDLLPLTPYVTSPEFALRKDPDYQAVAGDLINGQLKQRYLTDAHLSVLDRIKDKVPVKDRNLVRTFIEEFDFKHNVAKAEELAAKMNPKVAAAAKAISNINQNYRSRYIDFKLQSFREHLPQAEVTAIDRVLKGESIRSAVRNTGVKQRDLKERLSELTEVENWGIEDYVTHAERGEYKIMRKDVDPDGKEVTQTVAIGATRGDAGRKAAQYLANNPDVQKLYVDNRPKLNLSEAGARLTNKQRRYLESKLSSRLNDDVDAIAEQLGFTAKELGLNYDSDTVRQKLQGLVKTKHGREVRAGVLKQRKDVLEGELNIFDIMPSYVYQMEKVLNNSATISRANKFLEQHPDVIGENKRKNDVIRNQIEYIAGKRQYSDDVLDGYADALLGIKNEGLGGYLEKTIGKNPFDTKTSQAIDRLTGLDAPSGRASRFVNASRQLQAYSKLGYRPTAAGINYLSGIQHAWVKLGTKYTKKGYDFYKTEEGKKLLREEAPWLGLSAATDFESHLDTTRTGESLLGKVAKPLGPFQEAEAFPRELSYVGNYLKARDSGMSDDAARIDARKAIRFQQGVYTAAALPHVLRTNSGRGFGQFKSYPIRELEFFSQLNKEEFARYTISTLAFGGPKAVVRVMQALPVIGFLLGFGENEIEDMLNYEPTTPVGKALGALSTGLPGLVNADVSSQVAPQVVGQSMVNQLGPLATDVNNAWKFVIEPLQAGNPIEAMEGVGKFSKRSAIALYNWSRLWEGLVSEDGYVKDEAGRKLYKLDSTWDKVQLGLGSTPADIARGTGRARTSLRELMENDRERAAARNFLTRELLFGDKVIGDDIIDSYIQRKYVALDGTGEGLEQSALNALTSQEMRIIQSAPLQQKEGLLRRLLSTPLQTN